MLTLILTILSCVAGVVFVAVFDWYKYRHTKPPYSKQSVEKRIQELSDEIDAHIRDRKYPLQTSFNILDYWLGELDRINDWNERNPGDRV